MGKLLKFLNACFKRLALHGVLKSLILISSLIFGMNFNKPRHWSLFFDHYITLKRCTQQKATKTNLHTFFCRSLRDFSRSLRETWCSPSTCMIMCIIAGGACVDTHPWMPAELWSLAMDLARWSFSEETVVQIWCIFMFLLKTVFSIVFKILEQKSQYQYLSSIFELKFILNCSD